MHIKARVKTGAKNERVRKVSDDHFEISVREKPEQNLANKRVTMLIAHTLNVPVFAVRLIKGHQSPSKIFDVKGHL